MSKFLLAIVGIAFLILGILAISIGIYFFIEYTFGTIYDTTGTVRALLSIGMALSFGLGVPSSIGGVLCTRKACDLLSQENEDSLIEGLSSFSPRHHISIEIEDVPEKFLSSDDGLKKNGDQVKGDDVEETGDTLDQQFSKNTKIESEKQKNRGMMTFFSASEAFTDSSKDIQNNGDELEKSSSYKREKSESDEVRPAFK